LLHSVDNVVYDYKFVDNPPGLKPGQVAKIQREGPRGADIVEVNPTFQVR
jgi:hypothetical protein